MAHFRIDSTPLPGLMLVERLPTADARGFFSRFFCANDLAAAGIVKPIVQINHTLTRRKGAARGMHFQRPPHAECKMVSCLRGEVFDVAVDLRCDSPTFLRWCGEVLSAKNRRSFVIPEGFAHGFQTLTEDCELLYLHTESYAPAAEGAVNIMDPRIGIAWPLPVTEMSERDRSHPQLAPDYAGISV